MMRAPQKVQFNNTRNKESTAQNSHITQVLKTCTTAKIPGVLSKPPGNQCPNTKMLKMEALATGILL